MLNKSNEIRLPLIESDKRGSQTPASSAYGESDDDKPNFDSSLFDPRVQGIYNEQGSQRSGTDSLKNSFDD